jgi:hypothetical protein
MRGTTVLDHNLGTHLRDQGELSGVQSLDGGLAAGTSTGDGSGGVVGASALGLVDASARGSSIRSNTARGESGGTSDVVVRGLVRSSLQHGLTLFLASISDVRNGGIEVDGSGGGRNGSGSRGSRELLEETSLVGFINGVVVTSGINHVVFNLLSLDLLELHVLNSLSVFSIFSISIFLDEASIFSLLGFLSVFSSNIVMLSLQEVHSFIIFLQKGSDVVVIGDRILLFLSGLCSRVGLSDEAHVGGFLILSSVLSLVINLQEHRGDGSVAPESGGGGGGDGGARGALLAGDGGGSSSLRSRGSNRGSLGSRGSVGGNSSGSLDLGRSNLLRSNSSRSRSLRSNSLGSNRSGGGGGSSLLRSNGGLGRGVGSQSLSVLSSSGGRGGLHSSRGNLGSSGGNGSSSLRRSGRLLFGSSGALGVIGQSTLRRIFLFNVEKSVHRVTLALLGGLSLTLSLLRVHLVSVISIGGFSNTSEARLSSLSVFFSIFIGTLIGVFGIFSKLDKRLGVSVLGEPFLLDTDLLICVHPGKSG